MESLIDTFEELSGNSNLVPLKSKDLVLFSDSTVALSWVISYVNKLDKIQKHTPFVMNRLETICQKCEIHPISFNFIAGKENPADLMTKPISYKLLKTTSYLSGPKFLQREVRELQFSDTLSFTVPNVLSKCRISSLSVQAACALKTVLTLLI